MGCKHLVGLDVVIDSAMQIILEELYLVTERNGAYRKKAMLFSRLARGGKTTTVQKLYDKLKNENPSINIMIISFNGSAGFKRLPGEHETDALYRVIASQLFSTDSEIYNYKVYSDWKKLDQYLGSEPFILIIDDFNLLTSLIGSDLSIILNKYFLDKKNRYLVMTSHIPIFIDYSETTTCTSNKFLLRPLVASLRSLHVVSLACSANFLELQNMSAKCSKITPMMAAYYGNIPSSLMFSEIELKENLYGRFAKIVHDNAISQITKDPTILQEFLTELFDGATVSSTLDAFRCLSSFKANEKGYLAIVLYTTYFIYLF
jgi:hypothetical protein